MPKIIKKRALKHDGSDEDLKETVEDIRSRLKERQRTLVIALVVFLIVIISAGAFYIYIKSQRDQSAAFQRDAFAAFYGESGAQPGAGVDYKKALELFKKSYDLKAKSDVLLYIGYCQYELGNYDEAIKTFKTVSEKFPDPRIIPLAYYKMAEAYLKKGDQNGALAILNDLAIIKDGIFHDMALMESARILEQQGKKEEAKAKYKELVTKYPNSVLAAEAKAKIAE